jgi:hypothetical protein
MAAVEEAMRTAAGIFGVLTVGVGLVAPAGAADHREAPIINQYPTADINDIYAFRNPSRSSRLVLVMTVNPLSDPDFAGSYAFSPDVLYRFEIDNNGDAIGDRRIDVTFSPLAAGAQTFTARFPGGLVLTGDATRPTVLSTTPNPPVIVSAGPPTNIQVFAGPRDDPFFFDAVGFNRFVNGVGGFRGNNSFGGFNVSALVVELPAAMVSGSSGKLQISGFTYIKATAFDPPRGTPTTTVDGVRYEQIERDGNPAVNTALIPGPLKDAFNFGLPKNDARDFGAAILASLNRFGTSPANIAILASVALPDTLKLDLAKPDGFPNGRRLQDDVIDTLLTLILNTPTSDGVDRDDRSFSRRFPYLAPPRQAR